MGSTDLTDGAQPYPGMPNPDVLTEVTERGLFPERPELCPEEVYALIKGCWAMVLQRRPSFTMLADGFAGLESGGPADPFEAVARVAGGAA